MPCGSREPRLQAGRSENLELYSFGLPKSNGEQAWNCSTDSRREFPREDSPRTNRNEEEEEAAELLMNLQWGEPAPNNGDLQSSSSVELPTPWNEVESEALPSPDTNRDVNRDRRVLKCERQRDGRRSWESWQGNGATAWSAVEPPSPTRAASPSHAPSRKKTELSMRFSLCLESSMPCVAHAFVRQDSTPAYSQRPFCSRPGRPQSYKKKDEGDGQTPPMLVNNSCQDQQLSRPSPFSEDLSPHERKRNGKSSAVRGPWTLNANTLAPEAHTQSTYHGDENSIRRLIPFWEHKDLERMTGLQAVQSLSPKSFTNFTPLGENPSQEPGFCVEYRRRSSLRQQYLARQGKSGSGCSRRISPNLLTPEPAMNARAQADREEHPTAPRASALPNFRIFEQLPVYPAGKKDIAVVAVPCRSSKGKKPADQEAPRQWYKRSYKVLRDNKAVLRLAA